MLRVGVELWPWQNYDPLWQLVLAQQELPQTGTRKLLNLCWPLRSQQNHIVHTERIVRNVLLPSNTGRDSSPAFSHVRASAQKCLAALKERRSWNNFCENNKSLFKLLSCTEMHICCKVFVFLCLFFLSHAVWLLQRSQFFCSNN